MKTPKLLPHAGSFGLGDILAVAWYWTLMYLMLTA
jgi:hypothetical protein